MHVGAGADTGDVTRDAGSRPAVAGQVGEQVDHAGRAAGELEARVGVEGRPGREDEGPGRSARVHLRRLAADLGLFTTGSSDYHGTGKLNRIGEHLTTAAVLAEIEAQGTGTPVVRP